MHEKVERCQITCLFLIFSSCTFLMALLKVSPGLQQCLENRTWLMQALSATRSSSNQKIADDLRGAIRKREHICKWYAVTCGLTFSMRAFSDMSKRSHWWCSKVHFHANKCCVGVNANFRRHENQVIQMRETKLYSLHLKSPTSILYTIRMCNEKYIQVLGIQ